MTEAELADRLGFTVNTLRHWERSSRLPECVKRTY
jgi:DNA-binding transcriptional regulator YiaG